MQSRFVDLGRYFTPIKAEAGIGGDSPYWGKRYGGWLQWPQLLAHNRVVVLAGAGSGKTEEFKHQTRVQRQLNRAAFFVRLEELADTPVRDAIDHQLSSDFDEWLRSNEPGWFFLDAVDELKLRGKRLDLALRGVAKALDTALDRAHIIISSRPADWDSRSDPAVLIDRLRPPDPEPPPVVDPNEALVGPVRERQARKTPPPQDRSDRFQVQTFGLAPLDLERVKMMAEGKGIRPAELFLDAIAANNLDSLAQTPLDVEVLTDYWQAHSKLDRLAIMVAYVVDRKLSEREPNRPDGNLFSHEEARAGVERIAAALTFGRALSVRIFQLDGHPTIPDDSPDISDILPDWSEAQRAALLRRGLFAPATYGRVRFHHRQTQDFLTACWLDRLIRNGQGEGAVVRLAFPNVYGEKIVVPSLVPALAWLALRQPVVREILLERQPMALVQSGDPSSLAIDVRRRVLQQYAILHGAGKVSNDAVWERQLALFADAGLAQTISDLWGATKSSDVRFQLMRVVGEAKIAACANLCAEIAFNAAARDYHRIVAAQALARCGADRHLTRLATLLTENADALPEQVSCGLALELFPRFLDADQLASVIDRAPRPKVTRTDLFPDKLDEFFAACRTAAERASLLRSLVRLCRQKPVSQDFERVSARHKKIAEHLGPLARGCIDRLGHGQRPPAVLVQALAVMQWVHDVDGRDEEESISQIVRRRERLNRALFWQTVIEDRFWKAERSREHWQLLPYRSNRQLWSLAAPDWPWLLADIKGARRKENRRVALVAAYVLVTQQASPPDGLDQLERAIAGDDILASALAELTAVPKREPWQDAEARRNRRWQCKVKIQEIRTERNWKAFRDRLAVDPERLADARQVTSPESVRDLHFLSAWLAKPKDHLDRNDRLNWHRLEYPFGRAVAESYRDGMGHLWRQAVPARPSRSEGGGISTPWLNILAFHAVLQEARESDDWPDRLSDTEAERAVAHLVLTEEGISAELISLSKTRPVAATSVLTGALMEEWRQPRGPRELLYHVARHADDVRHVLSGAVLDLVCNAEPDLFDVYDLAIDTIRKMDLSTVDTARLHVVALQRLENNVQPGLDEAVLRALALLFLIDPSEATTAAKRWLGAGGRRSNGRKAEMFFARLFGRDGALMTVSLPQFPVGTLEELYRLCRDTIKSEDDQDRPGGGSHTSSDRDKAEDARNGLLNAIINRPGRATYNALSRLGRDRLWGDHSNRAFELARERSEKDGDLTAPWAPSETIDFERKLLSPIKNGDDLMRVICELLRDIQDGFIRNDATSRGLLALAPDEDHVQNWFAEQLTLRSGGRFHAFREARVAENNRTDVIVASTSSDAQLVVEIKHGGKGWTIPDLEEALLDQLAGKYLRPKNRKHGVLLVTNHNRHFWKCPGTEKRLSFQQVLVQLNTIGESRAGDIQVSSVGLNLGVVPQK